MCTAINICLIIIFMSFLLRSKQDKKCTYKVAVRRLGATIVAVEKQ